MFNIEEVSVEFIGNVIDKRIPEGLFLAKEGEWFTAVDNRDGDAWTECFRHKEVAIKWLTDELDTDEAYELDNK